MFADEPDLRDAALDLVGRVLLLRSERRQRLPELDQVAVAVLPILKKGEVLFDVLESLRRRHAPYLVHPAQKRSRKHGAACLRLGQEVAVWSSVGEVTRPLAQPIRSGLGRGKGTGLFDESCMEGSMDGTFVRTVAMTALPPRHSMLSQSFSMIWPAMSCWPAATACCERLVAVAPKSMSLGAITTNATASQNADLTMNMVPSPQHGILRLAASMQTLGRAP